MQNLGFDGASRHTGDYGNQPVPESPLPKMMDKLKATFDSFNNLNLTNVNYDHETRTFSKERDAVAEKVDKVSNLTKSAVRNLHEGFSDLVSDMEAIKTKLRDPNAKYTLSEIEAIEDSFLHFYESSSGFLDLSSKFENEDVLLKDDAEVLLKQWNAMKVAVLERIMELKSEMMRDVLREAPDPRLVRQDKHWIDSFNSFLNKKLSLEKSFHKTLLLHALGVDFAGVDNEKVRTFLQQQGAFMEIGDRTSNLLYRLEKGVELLKKIQTQSKDDLAEFKESSIELMSLLNSKIKKVFKYVEVFPETVQFFSSYEEMKQELLREYKTVKQSLMDSSSEEEFRNIAQTFDDIRTACKLPEDPDENIWKMNFSLREMESLVAKLSDPEARFTDEALEKLEKDFRVLYDSFSSLDSENLRNDFISMIVKKRLERIEKTIDGLWLPDGKINNAYQHNLKKQFADLQKWKTEAENSPENSELYNLVKNFIENPENNVVIDGKKIIGGKYGQTSDVRIDSIQKYVNYLKAQGVGFPQRKLLKLCAQEILDLSYELADPAKVEAFYLEKTRILNDIREFQERKGWANDALFTKKTIDGLQDKQKIDLLDESTLKEKSLVAFEVGGQFFKVEKASLKFKSEVLAAMVEGKFKEGSQTVVSISEVDPADFRAMLDFLAAEKSIESDDPNTYVTWWELGNQFLVPSFRREALVKLSTSATALDLLPLVEHRKLFEELVKCTSKNKVEKLIKMMVQQMHKEVEQDASDEVVASLARGIVFARKSLNK